MCVRAGLENVLDTQTFLRTEVVPAIITLILVGVKHILPGCLGVSGWGGPNGWLTLCVYHLN